MPPGIQNNPNVNTAGVNNTPPSNTPPPDAGRTDGAQRPPAEGSAPPPESPRGASDVAGGAGNPGALPNTGTPDLTRMFEGDRAAQQQLIDVGAQGEQVAEAQDGNATARADTSMSRVEGQQADGQVDNRSAERSFVSSQAQQRLTDAPNTQRQFANFLTQGSQNPNPNANRTGNNQGSHDAAMNREFQALQDAMNRGQPEGGVAGRRQATGEQPATFRAHAFGFLARDVNTGRQMGYIVTRQPIASQAGRTPENPENPEAHAQDTPHGEDAAHAGRFAAAARTRVPGERRVGADRANDDNTDNDNAGEGGEGGSVANRETTETNPVIAAFLSQHGGGGQGEEGEAQSTREVIDNAVVVFGEASPDDAARLRSEHTVGSAITAGTGHYVHRLNLGQRSGNSGQSGVPSGDEALVMGATGVHAGRESDMGELRRLSLNVNGEMIDMGSAQGQARFEEICSTNPEVREAAMGLVEQRRNFTTHVTANLFRADGGEPSARA